MTTLATDALPVFALFAPAFSPSVFPRAQLLAVAAVLGSGRRTVANGLRLLGWMGQGDPASYHRVLSQAHWSGLQVARLLVSVLVRGFCPSGPIRVVGDDTVTEHPGKKVHGKARHRDPVRSSHSYTAYRWGHKWVVLALLIRFPFAQRPWALPVLVALYRSPKDNVARCRPHKTPAQVMRLLLRVLMRWLPDRSLVFAGDTGHSTHETACLACAYPERLTVVGKFPPDGSLYAPPPPYKGVGRRPQKGAKLPPPADVVAGAERTPVNVAWYGGGRRDVEVVSGVGLWYRAGQGVVTVRWVWVHDLTGTHRDEYFYSTDVTMTPQEIIETYTGRWNLETTFQETRAFLGLETTQGWCAPTVLRAEPCLFGLYSVVALWYAQLPEETQAQGAVHWVGKTGTTFSDAISAVRRWLWSEWVLPHSGHGETFAKLPAPLREALLYALAPAA